MCSQCPSMQKYKTQESEPRNAASCHLTLLPLGSATFGSAKMNSFARSLNDALAGRMVSSHIDGLVLLRVTL